MVMVADDEGKVTYISTSMNDTKSKAKAFLELFDGELSKDQRIRVHKVIGWDEAMKNVKVEIKERPFNESKEETELKNKQQDEEWKKIQKYAKYKATESYLGGSK